MLLGIYLSCDMCNHKTPTRVDVCTVNMSLIVYAYDSRKLHLSKNTRSKTQGLTSLAKGNMKDHEDP